MRIDIYDTIPNYNVTVSSVAINSYSGSSAVDSDSFDTSIGLENLLVHVRAEIASGSPSAATLAWALQESSDNSTWAAANDNTGTAIGGTLNVHTTAQDAYARIEGIMLYQGNAAAPQGGRKRYLRIVFTPAFTSGTSPAILAYAEFIGSPGNGMVLPVRTTVSNT
jgi:hypothetical protein